MSEEAKVNVLVVDDDKAIRDFLKRLFVREGLDVQTAEDGFQAVAAAQKEKFDLIFLDIRMPMKNGVETLRELKQMNPETKYIMMTGYAVEDLLREAEREGVVLTLHKPFDIYPLVELIRGFKKGASPSAALDILVVDDDVNILDFFRKLLKDHRVMTVGTGREALDVVKKQNFDLVFLDVALGDARGTDLCPMIQEIRPDLEVIIMTGYSEIVKDEVKKLNINCIFSKPMTDISKILFEIQRVKKIKKH